MKTYYDGENYIANNDHFTFTLRLKHGNYRISFTRQNIDFDNSRARDTKNSFDFPADFKVSRSGQMRTTS